MGRLTDALYPLADEVGMDREKFVEKYLADVAFHRLVDLILVDPGDDDEAILRAALEGR